MTRRKRRVRRMRVSHDRWLVSYADFITLLFAFFVVMYSTSQVDKHKIGKLAAAIQVAFAEMGAFPASTTGLPVSTEAPMPLDRIQTIEDAERRIMLSHVVPPAQQVLSSSQSVDLTKLRRELEQALAKELARKQLALRDSPDGLVISLREIGFFEVGSKDIRTPSLAAFGRIADLLGQRPYNLRIEGHTDDVPIHNSEFVSNWELSTARATQIVRLLITNYGFAPERLSAAGYAQYHPIAGNDSAEGRALNRRVDIVVLRKGEVDSGAGQSH